MIVDIQKILISYSQEYVRTVDENKDFDVVHYEPQRSWKQNIKYFEDLDQLVEFLEVREGVNKYECKDQLQSIGIKVKYIYTVIFYKYQ